MDLYDIDLTGHDIFAKGSGVVVVYRNASVRPYGYRIPEELQIDVRANFSSGSYGFTNRRMVKPRFYAVLVSLMLASISDELDTDRMRYRLNICNDFDGHEHDIIQTIRSLATESAVFSDLTRDHFLFTRHPKGSLVQRSALRLYRGEYDALELLDFEPTMVHNGLAKRAYRREKW